MNDYIRFITALIAGAIIGISLYRLLISKKLPLSSVSGIALGGSSMGALGGIILASVYGLDDTKILFWGLPCLIAILGAMVS